MRVVRCWNSCLQEAVDAPSIPGGVQGLVGWGPGQPGLVLDVEVGGPACGGVVGASRSLGSLPTQPFCDSGGKKEDPTQEHGKHIKPFCVPICRLDEDPNRFPQVIADAECRLLGCLNSLGQEDRSLNSVPITQEILVLRREQRGCQPTYHLEKKLITVGCTCAAPVIQHQS